MNTIRRFCHHPPLPHSFIPGSFPPHTSFVHHQDYLNWSMLRPYLLSKSVFVFSYFLFCFWFPCGRLSGSPVSFSAHAKYFISYRVVLYLWYIVRFLTQRVRRVYLAQTALSIAAVRTEQSAVHKLETASVRLDLPDVIASDVRPLCIRTFKTNLCF